MPVSGDVSDNAEDPDEDTLLFSAASSTTVQGGTVSLTSNGEFTYTPPTNYSGADSFEYTADDGHGGTTTKSVFIFVGAAVTGYVWADDDLDGIKTDDEVRLGGVLVSLTKTHSNTTVTTTTNALGWYQFAGSYDGEYRLQFGDGADEFVPMIGDSVVDETGMTDSFALIPADPPVVKPAAEQPKPIELQWHAPMELQWHAVQTEELKWTAPKAAGTNYTLETLGNLKEGTIGTLSKETLAKFAPAGSDFAKTDWTFSLVATEAMKAKITPELRATLQTAIETEMAKEIKRLVAISEMHRQRNTPDVTSTDMMSLLKVPAKAILEMGIKGVGAKVDGAISDWFIKNPLGLDASNIKIDGTFSVSEANKIKYSINAAAKLPLSDTVTISPMIKFSDGKYAGASIGIDIKW